MLRQEKEADKKTKQKQRDRMQPKMGKLDIDYQVLHDAFFKFQQKPSLSTMGDLYYEGKEFEAKVSWTLNSMHTLSSRTHVFGVQLILSGKQSNNQGRKTMLCMTRYDISGTQSSAEAKYPSKVASDLLANNDSIFCLGTHGHGAQMFSSVLEKLQRNSRLLWAQRHRWDCQVARAINSCKNSWTALELLIADTLADTSFKA